MFECHSTDADDAVVHPFALIRNVDVVAASDVGSGKIPDGSVVASGGVIQERRDPLAVLKPMVLLESAANPLAVLARPVVLLWSASDPLAVLAIPVVLPRSASHTR